MIQRSYNKDVYYQNSITKTSVMLCYKCVQIRILFIDHLFYPFCNDRKGCVIFLVMYRKCNGSERWFKYSVIWESGGSMTISGYICNLWCSDIICLRNVIRNDYMDSLFVIFVENFQTYVHFLDKWASNWQKKQ